MKVAKCVVALIALGCCASSASALTSVWFEVQGTPNPTRGILELQPNQTYTLELRMTSTQTALSWGLDLTGPAGSGLVVNSYTGNTGTVAAGGFGGGSLPGTEVPGPAPALLTNAGGYNLNGPWLPPQATGFLLATLSLTAPGTAGGAEITGLINANEWGWIDPDTGNGGAQDVSFAGAAAIPGAGGTSAGTLIRIIPEPATLVLLGIGCLALIRRR